MSTEIMTIQNVRAYVDAQGTAWLNAEDVARGLGFVHNETKNGVEYSTIRWSTVNNYLQEFGFANKVAKDSFIPENMFYRLAMKASNAAAEKFQALVADEILPTLRKTGTYSIVTPAPVADMVRDVRITADEIQALFAGVKRGIAISDGIWRLTAQGTVYGEEMPYTKNGHSGYQIRRNENVIDFLRAVLAA